MRALIISAIVLVPVMMGIGVISPMILQAEAGHGGPDLSHKACVALQSMPNPPAAVVELIQDHCVTPKCPNPSHLGFVFEGEITSINFDFGNLLGGLIAEGETWSTFYCLAPNTPDTAPGANGQYEIDFIAITIGDNDEFVCNAQVLAIEKGANIDTYQVFCFGMTPPVLPPFTLNLFNIFLGTRNTGLLDGSLPAFAPDLNDFEFQTLDWRLGNSLPPIIVEGTITSFVRVQ